jgi:uncharacterized membrane protein YidH (DUF202 family)
MTGTGQIEGMSSNELALERTRMAGVRTEFALMRTGFAIASFGAGVAGFLGRGTWPDLATDLLTSVFVLVGMICVQAGWIHSRSNLKALGLEIHKGAFSRQIRIIIPWLLQLSLLSLLILILAH